MSQSPSSNGYNKHCLETGKFSPIGERSCQVIVGEGPSEGAPGEPESLGGR